ncbi:MAG: hypothetical protein ACR2PG_23930 [Hyphomicrobiaceae bacterium]
MRSRHITLTLAEILEKQSAILYGQGMGSEAVAVSAEAKQLKLLAQLGR